MNFLTLTAAWGIDFSEVDSNAHVEGSPERTAARTVVRDTSGNRWILEKIAPDNFGRKREIAEQLENLLDLTQIHPYRRTADNSFFHDHGMLRSYVDGVPLNRETYLSESWRIDALTDFLIRLRAYTVESSGPFFSITDYAETRMTAWRGRCSNLTEKLDGSFSKLKQSFFPLHDQLPVAFCHGDYHPLNMVWGENSIRSVIDWEFCGRKPELYDAALLVGCIGFEDPDNLIHEPVVRLVKTLRAAGYGAPESWDSFLDLVATIRFGWMSEWIRRSDDEAIEMEVVYIDILIGQKDYISQKWNM